MSQCLICKQPLEDEARFCPWCGIPRVDACPGCRQFIRVGQAQCPKCKALLRYCPECYQPAPLQATVCGNQDWGCAGTPLRDFFNGYAMFAVDRQRSGTLVEEGLTEPHWPRIRNDLKTPWIYRENGPLSEVISAYGKLYFVSQKAGVLRSVNERAPGEYQQPQWLELSPSQTEVVAQSETVTSLQQEGTAVRNLMAAEGIVTFRHDRPGLPDVYRFDAGTLRSLHAPLRGPYRAHLLIPEGWLLFAQDGNGLRIERYGSGPETKPVATYNVGTGLELAEAVQPVLVDDAVFFVVSPATIFRLALATGQVEPLRWRIDSDDVIVEQLAYGGGFLRFLARYGPNQLKFRLYALDVAHLNTPKKGWDLDKIFDPQVRLLGSVLWLHNRTDEALTRYSLEAEPYQPLPSLRVSQGEQILHFLPLQIQGQEYVLLALRPQGSRTIDFRLRNVERGTEDWRLNTLNESEDPVFLYANGRAFLCQRTKGTIEAMDLFR